MQPESITLPGRTAPITWRRSARARRISLRIEPRAGGVIVTLPARASVAAGRAVLATYRDWVAERLARLPLPVVLGHGATVMLDGAPRQIRHRPDARGTTWLEGGDIHVAGHAAFIERRVVDWLRTQARRQLGQLAREKAAGAGLGLRRVTIKDTSSRWGSCTASGTVMFSWRLVMAPPFVQDYVVGHEVAHLRHMNHGAEFWALADRLTPHRSVANAWLSANGAGLMRVG
ncbi:MAG: SprT family zinc-dependent metalloprotease [Acetobacteraceae bacterium]|nr:SprT family zinc-dependent metalloprotease [Acetobacteraceae bacterium]